MSAATPLPSSLRTPDLYVALEPITVPAKDAIFENWAQTFRCAPLAVFEPKTERHLELIVELARREGRTIRPAGVGHSPSDLACTSGFMVRMGHMDAIIEVRNVSCFFPSLCLRDRNVRLGRRPHADARFGASERVFRPEQARERLHRPEI
jgi:hypothetical protein